MLAPLEGQNIYTYEEKAEMRYNRLRHAACAVDMITDKFIVVTGSMRKDSESKAEKYNVTTNTWTTLPDLNKGRMDHGMCAMGSTVYVFCGKMNRESNSLIEYLNLDLTIPTWNEIVMPIRNINDRRSCSVAAINDHEIAIVGG